MQATWAKQIQNICSIACFPCLCLTCCCCPQGWVPCLFHCVKHPFMWATRAFKKLKFFALLHAFLVYFWHAAAALKSRVSCFFFHGTRHLSMQATWAKKIKIFAPLHAFLVYFWLDAAALRAGGPVYFMEWSTFSCKQRELEHSNFLLYCMLSLYIFDLLMLHSGHGSLLIWRCKAPFNVISMS